MQADQTSSEPKVLFWITNIGASLLIGLLTSPIFLSLLFAFNGGIDDPPLAPEVIDIRYIMRLLVLIGWAFIITSYMSWRVYKRTNRFKFSLLFLLSLPITILIFFFGQKVLSIILFSYLNYY
jgi:O-antigen/teichoic acid export membrane protein